MDKIREQIAEMNIDTDRYENSTLYRQRLAHNIHQTYLKWLEFYLPDLESGWTLEMCLKEIERIFIEE